MAICEAFRFMPGLGPGMPFRFTGFDGGANKLLFVDVGGIGVALESDALAEGDGSATGLDGGRLEPVEEDDVDFVDADRSERISARRSGGSRRVTTLDFGCFAVDFEVDAGDSVVMVDDIAMCYCRDVWTTGC